MSLNYARTKDGDLAVRIAHFTMAMVKAPGGDLRIMTCYPAKDPADCSRDDFYGGQPVNDETDFRAKASEQAYHYQQVDALGRKKLTQMISTPWGLSQTRMEYAEGIESVSTASHGGFMLGYFQNEVVDERWRSRDGSYEEDCDWAIVAHTFPELFTDYERRLADRSLRSWQPDAYEAITGKTIQPGESWQRDQENFLKENASKFITVSAVNSSRHEGMVECGASIGGDRNGKISFFLVPKDEYQIGFGFIIDEARHARLA